MVKAEKTGLRLCSAEGSSALVLLHARCFARRFLLRPVYSNVQTREWSQFQEVGLDPLRCRLFGTSDRLPFGGLMLFLHATNDSRHGIT